MTKEEKAKLLEEGKTEAEISQMEVIAEMKIKMDAMIDPEKHAELKTEYDKLLKDYVNKRPVPKKKEKVLRPIKEIAQELATISSGDITNREYIEKSLEYREAYIKKFGTDPFTDSTTDGPSEPTPQTKKVAESFQKLLDENPSPIDFRLKMNSVMKDNATLLRNMRKRAN